MGGFSDMGVWVLAGTALLLSGCQGEPAGDEQSEDGTTQDEDGATQDEDGATQDSAPPDSGSPACVPPPEGDRDTFGDNCSKTRRTLEDAE